LLILQSPERPKLPNKDTMAEMLQNTSNINKLILAATVDTLWNRLQKVLQSEEPDEGMAENWCHVFRSLRCRLKNRSNLVENLAPTLLIHFDLQMCTFLFALNFSLSPAQLFAFLGSEEVKFVWFEVLRRTHMDNEFGERLMYRGMSRGVRRTREGGRKK
jgi:hypothetical protein